MARERELSRLNPRRIVGRHLLIVCCLAAASGCATDDPGISPKRAELYYPSALALDPLGELLYVANSNADLRYNGGTLTALDLRGLPADNVDFSQTAGCQPDRIDGSRWECDAEKFIIPKATVRIGDFSGDLQITTDGTRIFAPMRGGDNHLLWVDAVRLKGTDQPVDLRCNRDPEVGCSDDTSANCEQWDCDDDHRVRFVEKVGEPLPSEPFGILLQELAAVFVDAQGRRSTWSDGVSGVPQQCGAEPVCVAGVKETECCIPASERAAAHVYLAHLVGGEVSMFTSGRDGVVLRDVRGGFFDTSASLKGGFALAASVPGDPGSPIYVSSRTDNVMASFLVEDDARIVQSRRTAIQAASPGTDVRGMAFSPGGQQLYAISQRPPSLVALDMRPDEDGQPRQAVEWIVEVCSDPTLVKLTPHPSYPASPQAQLAWVVCFGEAAIFVVDTVLGRLVERIETGAGPNGLVFDRKNRRAFVANFAENTIGIIDLDPQSPNYRRLIARIGMRLDLIGI